MLCPVCRTTMSETRPYVWSCSFCGNTEFKPNESSSYARSEDTSTSSGYTNSYDTGSSYTSSYDTSSSYGAPNYSYGGSGSRGSYNSGKLSAAETWNIILASIGGCIFCLLLGGFKGILCFLPVYWIALFLWDKVGGFFGKFMAIMFFLIVFYFILMNH